MRAMLGPLLLALSLTAAAQSDDVPEPPAYLAPYIEDGRFHQGDFAWVEGAFEDAGPEAQAEFAAYQQWMLDCFEQSLAELRARVSEAGFPNAPLEGIGPAPILCREARWPRVPEMSSYAAFRTELDAALPVVETYLFAVEQAQRVSRPRVGEGVDVELRWRVMGDQMVRGALFWRQATEQGAAELSPAGQAIAQAMLGSAMARHDYENTRWLRGYLDEHGWPPISQVGEQTSFNAWLLAQHADHDPLFQLRILREMEPMVADGEVNSRNYAYLYDRVMLKLTGQQRYGTQAGCIDGELGPRPLEVPEEVDALREELGLEPLSEYIDGMRSMSSCASLPDE